MSPFSGCLSSIIQIVIILSVFWLVSQPLTYMKRVDKDLIEQYKQEIQEGNNGQKSSYAEIEVINKKGKEDERVSINMDFLGLDLSKVPGNNLNDWKVYIIPLLYVVSSIISIKMSTDMTNKKKKNEIVDENKDQDELDTMQAMNKNMTYMMPIMSVMIAFIAPLGLALYWFISNLLMIVERVIINRIMEHKEEEENA